LKTSAFARFKALADFSETMLEKLSHCGVRKIGDRRQPLTPTLSPLLRRGAREKIGPAVRAV
jgi:hypothetical protein